MERTPFEQYEHELAQARRISRLEETVRKLEERILRLEQNARGTDREWISHGQDEWSLFDEDTNKAVASIYRSPGREMFTVHVWPPVGEADMDHYESEHEAKTWCEKQLRKAARINARAAELERTGAVDASEGSEEFNREKYLEEMADAKADADYSH